MSRILLVEDDRSLGATLRFKGLSREGRLPGRLGGVEERSSLSNRKF
jgi:hypothetical protein